MINEDLLIRRGEEIFPGEGPILHIKTDKKGMVAWTVS